MEKTCEIASEAFIETMKHSKPGNICLNFLIILRLLNFVIARKYFYEDFVPDFILIEDVCLELPKKIILNIIVE